MTSRRSLTVSFATLSLATAALMSYGSPASPNESQTTSAPTVAAPQASKGGIRLVVFNEGRPGLLTERGVVDVSGLVRPLGGHDAMQAIITRYDELKPQLLKLAADGPAKPLSSVTLKAPVPRAKLLAMGGNYREFGARKPEPMWGFIKSTDSILGSGATVVLPEIDANIFHHEAELVVVFGKACSNVPQDKAMDCVFGFTGGIDVSARMPPNPNATGGGRDITKMVLSAGKSYNGFSPIGPVIVPKDEIGDPQNLDIKLWVNGELRPNYNTSDAAHSIAESIAWALAITPVQPGDVLFMGTNHQGLGAMQDGDKVELEISKIGRLTVMVADPSKRRWPRGVDEATAEGVRNGTGAPGSKSRPLK
ncbi:MAG: fumarylacetoacetate hydrolase family protein [Vicinamibacteria bacterium]|nr:fumarylacetoacetate hydrolase family protein [Vicinamibacteria bacterium]